MTKEQAREMPEELKTTGRKWLYYKEHVYDGHWWHDGVDMVLLGKRAYVVLHGDQCVASAEADTFAKAWEIAHAMIAAGERR